MRDRVSTYPGRVKLAPVAGQENVYDLIRMDEPMVGGTPLNKASLLTDATAALYGKTLDPVPDDILAELGRYKLHWWQAQGTSWQEAQEEIESEKTLYLGGGWAATETNTLYYSSSVGVDRQSGAVSLVSPASLTLSYNHPTTDEIAATLAGKYVKGFLADVTWDGGQGAPDPNIYLMDSGLARDDIQKHSYRDTADVHEHPLLYGVYVSASAVVARVASEFKADPTSPGGYVQSADEDAYPHAGIQGGIEYTYLGIPLDNTIGVPRVATGNYVGTGAETATITVGFKPLFLLIFQRGTFWGSSAWMTARPWTSFSLCASTSTGTRSAAWGESSVSVSSSHEAPNKSGETYDYICFGI